MFVSQFELYLVHGWEAEDGTVVRPLEVSGEATASRPSRNHSIDASKAAPASPPQDIEHKDEDEGHADYADEMDSPAAADTQGLVVEKMQNYAIAFLKDSFCQNDAVARLQVISSRGFFGKYIKHIHNFRQRKLHGALVIGVLFILLLMTMNKKYSNLAIEFVVLFILGIEFAAAFMYELLPLRQLTSRQASGKRKIQASFYIVCVLDWFGHAAIPDVYSFDAYARAYLYLGLVVLQSESMWRSFTDFGSAVINASKVIWLFLCALLVISSMSLVLLKGKYQTNDYYTDQQFADFFR